MSQRVWWQNLEPLRLVGLHVIDEGQKALFSLIGVAPHASQVLENQVGLAFEEHPTPEPLDQRSLEEDFALGDRILLENMVERYLQLVLVQSQL